MKRDVRALVLALCSVLGTAAITVAADYASARWVPVERGRSKLGEQVEVERGRVFGIEWGRREASHGQ
jgi:hypothetical protein